MAVIGTEHTGRVLAIASSSAAAAAWTAACVQDRKRARGALDRAAGAAVFQASWVFQPSWILPGLGTAWIVGSRPAPDDRLAGRISAHARSVTASWRPSS
jgi:hypothetical protein